MAAVDHYSSTLTKITMDGFPSSQQPPLDLSDYIVFDETLMPTSSGQLPPASGQLRNEGLILQPSASYADIRSSGGSSSSTRQVNKFF